MPLHCCYKYELWLYIDNVLRVKKNVRERVIFIYYISSNQVFAVCNFNQNQILNWGGKAKSKIQKSLSVNILALTFKTSYQRTEAKLNLKTVNPSVRAVTEQVTKNETKLLFLPAPFSKSARQDHLAILYCSMFQGVFQVQKIINRITHRVNILKGYIPWKNYKHWGSHTLDPLQTEGSKWVCEPVLELGTLLTTCGWMGGYRLVFYLLNLSIAKMVNLVIQMTPLLCLYSENGIYPKKEGV